MRPEETFDGVELNEGETQGFVSGHQAVHPCVPTS